MEACGEEQGGLSGSGQPPNRTRAAKVRIEKVQSAEGHLGTEGDLTGNDGPRSELNSVELLLG